MVNMRSDGTVKSPVDEGVFPSVYEGGPYKGDPEDLTFLDVLLIITQRKKLVGIVTLIGTAIALLLAFALPQEYTATVIILPPQGNSSMSSMLASQLEGVGGAVSENDGKPTVKR